MFIYYKILYFSVSLVIFKIKFQEKSLIWGRNMIFYYHGSHIVKIQKNYEYHIALLCTFIEIIEMIKDAFIYSIII